MVVGQGWTEEEKERLRRLSIDPVQRPPHELVPLVECFSNGGSVRAVSEGSTSPHVSKLLARKLRDLTQDGELDWVLHAPRLKEHDGRMIETVAFMEPEACSSSMNMPI